MNNKIPLILKLSAIYLLGISILFILFAFYIFWLIFISGKDLSAGGFAYSVILTVTLVALPFFLAQILGLVLLLRRKKLGWIILVILMILSILTGLAGSLRATTTDPLLPWVLANMLISFLILTALLLKRKSYFYGN